MTLLDTFHLSIKTISSYRLRSALIILAMALGVAAVVVLTALGDGARNYIVNQFSSIGTNLLVVLPGRAETSGAFPGAVLGQTPRDLTLKDAELLGRLPQVKRFAPLNVGEAELSAANRLREVTVLGSNANLIPIRHMQLAQGSFLSQGSGSNAQIILGAKLAQEFFPQQQAIGQRVRLGGNRFLVTGVLAPQGESMGFNSDEIVIIPVEQAQSLFNTTSLFRILIEAANHNEIEPAKKVILEMLKQSHDGEEDVTVITQDAILSTFDRILHALTLAVAGIAAISLVVAGILIMNVMLVAVSQRTNEIGLLKAIGARAEDIRLLFFTEALCLSFAGAVTGFLLGQAGSLMLRLTFPQLPAWAPTWAIFASILVALATGILACVIPANRAARLDAALALSKK
jgi:putative ABC transport system permease protein